jgi:hypothetical protein
MLSSRSRELEGGSFIGLVEEDNPSMKTKTMDMEMDMHHKVRGLI